MCSVSDDCGIFYLPERGTSGTCWFKPSRFDPILIRSDFHANRNRLFSVVFVFYPRMKLGSFLSALGYRAVISFFFAAMGLKYLTWGWQNHYADFDPFLLCKNLWGSFVFLSFYIFWENRRIALGSKNLSQGIVEYHQYLLSVYSLNLRCKLGPNINIYRRN